MQYRRDNVVLRTTCIKSVKFKIFKIRVGCQNVGYLYYSKNLNWAAQNLQLSGMWPEDHRLDIAVPVNATVL